MKTAFGILFKVLLAFLVLSLLIGFTQATLDTRMSASHLLSKAEQYMQQGDYTSAISFYSRSISAHDRSGDAYLGLARAYYTLGDLASALQVAEEGCRKAVSASLSEFLAMVSAEYDELTNELPSYVAHAIAAYNGLTDVGQITDEMLAQVTTLTLHITGCRYTGDLSRDPESVTPIDLDYYVCAEVNGAKRSSGIASILSRDRFETLFLQPAAATLTSDEMALLENSFVLLDQDAPDMNDSLWAHYSFRYPLNQEACYLLKASVTLSELTRLDRLARRLPGTGADALTRTASLDLRSLHLLPNLESIELITERYDPSEPYEVSRLIDELSSRVYDWSLPEEELREAYGLYYYYRALQGDRLPEFSVINATVPVSHATALKPRPIFEPIS